MAQALITGVEMASQDEWCRPLADELVDVFRVQSLSYIRRVTGYSPATGETSQTETVYAAAGAVTKMSNIEEGGVLGPQTLMAWVNLKGIGDIWPTTNDLLEYEGSRWKIENIDPMFAGDLKYAAKLTARKA